MIRSASSRGCDEGHRMKKAMEEFLWDVLFVLSIVLLVAAIYLLIQD
jgi:hypothetical protein